MKVNFTYKKLQWVLVLFMFFSMSNYLTAQSLTFWIKSPLTGTISTPLAWNTPGNWTTTSNNSTIAATRAPQAGDTVNILAGKFVSIGTFGSNPFTNVIASCGILNISGSNANLAISGSCTLNCNTINVDAAGTIRFMSNNNIATSCTITCSGDVNLGTTTSIGNLNMLLAATITCNKLKLGRTSVGVINGVITNRNTVNFNCTFRFTGFGNDVIPEITLGENATTPDFFNVILDPGENNTITLPPNFSVARLRIESGIIDTSNNYNYLYNVAPGGLVNTNLSMTNGTTLKIGGALGMPNFKTFDLSPNSTTEFYGSQQTIKGIGEGYQKIILSGGTSTTRSVKSVEGGNLLVYVDLQVLDHTTLDLAGNDLILLCQYLDNTSGNIRSNGTSSITYNASVGCSMRFDNSNPGLTNAINNFNIGDNNDPQVNIPTPSQPLDIEIKNALNIKGTVNLYGGHLISNGNVTFKSDGAKTAFVGPITDLTNCGIIGNVTVERFIPAGSNNDGINLGRAFRGLSSSVTGGTIFSNWQENGSVATLTGSILGNTLTTTINPSTPLIVGHHISGNLIPANTIITSIDNAASNEYEISTEQIVASRGMVAYTSISTATVKARFTGTITSFNQLEVTAFTSGSGQLAVGQRIAGGTLPNTIITALGTGTGGLGTYTIGLEIPSDVIHYNGAPAGYGTHITGLPSTDAQLGQNDSTTGIDFTRSGNPSLYTFANGATTFSPVTNTKDEDLVAGNPYLILVRGDRTIDLALNNTPPTNTTLRSTGTIVEGAVEITKDSNTIVGGQFLNDTLNSFNFVGNPYQAPVDLNLIYSDPAGSRWVDLGTSYTVFDSKMNTRGAYVTYDFLLGRDGVVDTSVIDSTIEPNQAFFVTTSGAAPSVIFNELDKVTTDNTYVPMFRTRQNTTPIIKGSICNAATNKALDGFVIAFGDSFNNTIVAEDTRKMTGNQDETIASLNDVNKMAIDKRNFPSETDEIPLSITQYRLTDYILKFNVSNFDQIEAFLIDTYTNTETALNNNIINSYPFTVTASIPASIAENRFKIVFRGSLSTISNTVSAFAVYPNPVVDNKFTIKSNQAFSGKDANVTILNAIGQKVYSTNGIFSTDGSLLVNPSVAISKGIYLVKVAVDGKVETKKLIIK